MNFFKIDRTHVNLDNVVLFNYTDEGWLQIFDGNSQPFCFYDPEKELYNALCNRVYGEGRTE